MRVIGSTITVNGTGVFAAASAGLLSSGTNRLDGNVINGMFTGNSAAK